MFCKLSGPKYKNHDQFFSTKWSGGNGNRIFQENWQTFIRLHMRENMNILLLTFPF